MGLTTQLVLTALSSDTVSNFCNGVQVSSYSFELVLVLLVAVLIKRVC